MSTVRPRHAPRRPTARSPFVLPALAVATALGACGGGGEGTTLGTVSIDEDLPPTRVRGVGPVPQVLPTVLPALPLDVESTEAYRSGDYASITRVAITELSLSVLSPESEDNERETFGAEDGMADDLSFFSRIDLYIVAEIDGEQQERLLGGLPENDPSLDPDPPARVLELDMTGVDILDFVEAEGGYEVRLVVNGTVPPDDVVFDGEVEYEVGVGFR